MQDHDKRYEVKEMEFAELNPAQREAVEDLTDNILLLAPAGTGKTNTLACRIANILAEGRAEPEEILCLTFTNKACREMKERIVLRAGEDGRRVLVRTFHGFCYDVIKTEAKRHSDLFADFTIFDEADCLAIIRDLLSLGGQFGNVYHLGVHRDGGLQFPERAARNEVDGVLLFKQSARDHVCLL